MKILLINDYNYELGGAEVIFFKTKELFESKGHVVKTFGSINNSRIPPIILGWFSFKYYLEVKKIVKDFKPDIVHVHSCLRRISPSVLIAVKKYKIPIIMTFHDFDILGSDYTLINKNLKFIKKIKLKFQSIIIKEYTDYFICPSTKLTKEISKYFNTNKVRYIPNFQAMQSINNSDTVQENSKLFIYVGRIEKYKGIDIIIRATDILIKQYGLKDIQIKIIGDGAAKKELINLIESYKLQKNIKFTGKIAHNNLPFYFKISQAVLIPSIYMENSPLVAYEAMANSKPIIATDIGGLPDLVINGKNGFLFNMGDSSKLAFYMSKLFDNIPLSNKLGKFGYEKVLKKFNKKSYYNKLISIYKKVSYV